MTLAAPRSRQGKFVLALAVMAVFVAIAGSLAWYSSSANAQLPLVINMDLDQAPDGPASINIGDPVTYTATAELTAPLPTATDNLVIEIYGGGAFPGNTVGPNVVCSGAGVGGPNGFGDGYSCVWAAPVLAGVYTTTFSGYATTTMGVPASEICAVTPGATDCAGYSFPDSQFITDTDGDTGTLSLNAPVTVVDATNFPGAPHTFVFTLAAGVTCQSDGPPGTNDDEQIQCDASDVVIGGTGGCALTGIVVVDGDIADESSVQVSIDGGTGTDATTCTVTLDTYFVDGVEEDPTLDFDIDPVTATKTFSTAEAAGEIRHRDIVDAASEDAAGTTDSDPLEDWCFGAPAGFDCGILVPQDDLDDARGSFHQACIINTTLTHTGDSGFIEWQIVAISGNPLATPVSISEVSGSPDLDEPCVQWSTAFTGVQNITATYDNGVGPVITFYWDGYCIEADGCVAIDDADITGDEDDADVVGLPLVKEWNDIDETQIVAVTGEVGADELLSNSGELDDWANRDCSDIPFDPGFCERANWDGLIWQEEAAFLINTPFGINVSAGPVSFIDYTYGSHDDAGGIYDGPVDGAEQTYTISGDCGSVRLEDPATGVTIYLTNDDDLVDNVNFFSSATVLSSDKGVGFTFYATSDGTSVPIVDTADCGPLAQICIDISTEEANLFRSPPIDDAEDESVCVEYTVGPPTNKTPILAWAGQRVVIEHYWGSGDTCVDLDGESDTQFQEFGVLYLKQNGPGSFTSALQGNTTDVDLTTDAAKVTVLTTPEDLNGDDVTDPNSNCTSRIIYESEDEGQVDISAFVVDADDDLSDADPRSAQVPFVIYFMKFEDSTLEIIDSETTHDPLEVDSSAENPPTGTDSTTANVSANVLTRLAVRGWVETTNCPARDSGVGQNGEFLPANRCIFPDDWNFKAGGVLALETRPEFDIHGGGGTVTPGSTFCSDNLAGPFSLLDILPDGTRGGCDDGLAPHYPADTAGTSCATGGLSYGCRDSNQPNGVINADDAPMPPALATFRLSGSGFMVGADKGNLFEATHIPAEPWISPINFDLSGYQWNTWGGSGAKSGLYDFWTDYAATGIEVESCPGLSPCNGGGVPTGGFDNLSVYTDEHGVAYIWANGDANLTFDECDSSAGTAGNDIVLLNGFYCEEGELVGSSTIDAIVDYPDKRKHFAILSNEVSVDWTWGGMKTVTVEPGAGPQFNYVVLHLTDRDGFCDPSPSLHPVIGEQVTFLIDSPNGVIFPDNNGIPAALLGTWSSKAADVTTFDTDAVATSALTVEPVIKDGECQAWIHVSESLLGPVNVIITAYDPEGTVVFDVIINEPTPTPAPVTPSPTPANQENLWADIDCDDEVNPVDSLKVLRHDAGLSITQNASCPDAGESVLTIWDAEAENEAWGDADCSGDISPIDSLKILRFDAGLFYIQQEPCPDIGSEVLISAQ